MKREQEGKAENERVKEKSKQQRMKPGGKEDRHKTISNLFKTNKKRIREQKKKQKQMKEEESEGRIRKRVAGENEKQEEK